MWQGDSNSNRDKGQRGKGQGTRGGECDATMRISTPFSTRSNFCFVPIFRVCEVRLFFASSCYSPFPSILSPPPSLLQSYFRSFFRQFSCSPYPRNKPGTLVAIFAVTWLSCLTSSSPASPPLSLTSCLCINSCTPCIFIRFPPKSPSHPP